jgi:hypothetical protein
MNSANCAELPRETAADGGDLAAVCPIQRHIRVIDDSAKSELGGVVMTLRAANSATPETASPVVCFPIGSMSIKVTINSRGRARIDARR